MIVTKENLSEVTKRFSKAGQYAIDTETDGLHPYLGDRLFSVILADSKGAVYANFKDYGDGSPFLEDPQLLRPILQNPDSYWFAHNAKFDLAMLRFAGLELPGTVHCTQAIARVLRNDKIRYNLDVLTAERGFKKSDAVIEYIMKHGLWEWMTIPGKKTRVKKLFFDRVPFNIMYEYGLTDGEITRVLGLCQIADIESTAACSPKNRNNIKHVYLNEMKVTKVCFNMEWAGARIDPAYIKEALRYEDGVKQEAEDAYKAVTGDEFVDGSKALTKTFTAFDLPIKRKEPTPNMVAEARKKGLEPLGNPQFDEAHLKTLDHEVTKLILKQRRAVKRGGTYHSSFLYFSDHNDVLHCTFKQDGTAHGRMSCAEPNLQNVPKLGDDKSAYPVRRGFVPPPECCLVMIDYRQMEYKLMLEYAKEMDLIEMVLAGHDVHQATADLITEAGVSCKREPAKNINFMMIYGGGLAKLAQMSGLSMTAAMSVRSAYNRRLPKVKQLVRNVIYTAENRGFIENWFGRRCHFQDPNFAYRAPNHMIAGGCADIVKLAMIACEKRLEGMRSELILQVHDELVFSMHKDELDVVPELQQIMETAYPHKLLPLTCGVDHSWKSWHDKIEGLPTV